MRRPLGHPSLFDVPAAVARPQVRSSTGAARPPVVAGIGSREITSEECEMLEQAGAWCARHGITVRSGGAVGADQAWVRGVVTVDPSCAIVALPADTPAQRRRVPRGAQMLLPPFAPWMVERAVAEYELGDRLRDLGLPPYPDPRLEDLLQRQPRWTRAAAREPMTPALMTRNASIVFPEEWVVVDLVLGVLNVKPGGGGTGHAFRLAQAAGVPTYNLRDAREREAALGALQRLAARGVTTPPTPEAPSGRETGGR